MPAFAQGTAWPAKPVQLVIPFPPAGGTDIIGRAVAARLQDRLGKPFVIDNKPGAGGILGTQQVARSAPDGYSYVIGITNTFAINPTFYRGKQLNYDPVKDFEPVAFLAESPHILVIHPDTPATTLQEYIAFAKTQKGKLSYASYGNGSTSHLITEMLKEQAGLDLVHVPYKGIPPALADVMGQRVSMLVSSPAPAVPLIQSKKLRALAIYGDRRIDSIPEVPTIGELGYKDAALTIWYALFAPAGTPRAIVERMNAEVNAVLAQKDVIEIFARAGIYPKIMSAGEFGGFVRSETSRWGKLVLLSGAQAE
jgi:tripartite-type tricarboxylate transporter receptor subunit TctC